MEIINNIDDIKIIAKENIKKGNKILIEEAIYKEKDIIYLLYIILKNKDDINIKNLYPRNNNNFINNSTYSQLLYKLINNYYDKKIRKYLLMIDNNTIYFYYFKILYNAFDMNGYSAILPIGSKMNHSCKPNVYFYQKNNMMYFEALIDIKSGDELCYSYLRNYKFINQKDKQTYLFNHYNFYCKCIIFYRIYVNSILS
jgi:SET domain-containing protein